MNDQQHAPPSDLSRIIHDFRTPAIAILTFADQALEQLVESVEIAQRIHSIRDNAEYILDLAASIIAGNEPDHAYSAPVTLVADTVYQLRAPAAAKRVELRIHAEEAVPSDLPMPPLHLKQLLYNLIGNAIRYAPREPVTVGLERYCDDRHQALRPLLETAPEGAPIFVLTVEDHGPGLERELLQAINGDTQNIVSRTDGLGLYICHRLARMSGWMLYAEQPAVGGTRMLLGCAVEPDIPWEPLPRLHHTDSMIRTLDAAVMDAQRYRQLALAALIKSTGHRVMVCETDVDRWWEQAQRMGDCRVLFVSKEFVDRGVEQTMRQAGFSGRIVHITEHDHADDDSIAMPFHREHVDTLLAR